MRQQCSACGYELSDKEVDRAMAGAYGDSPAMWGYTEDEVEWFCGDCYREVDTQAPEEFEVGWLGN